MAKNAYHYHPTTGEYLGSSNADPSPLEPGEYLYPAHSTPLAPPADIPAGKVARYQAGAWELVDDLRGTKYWTADGVEHTQDALGALPVGVALEAPLPPPPSIEQQIASALADTYADVDAIYAAAIGSRAPEYEQTEQAALAFQAAGYTGTASPYVADYAATAGITDQQSADLIIARANGLRAAVLAMRSTRFTAQSTMRAATTQAELDAAVAAWRAFIAQVRTSLGL